MGRNGLNGNHDPCSRYLTPYFIRTLNVKVGIAERKHKGDAYNIEGDNNRACCHHHETPFYVGCSVIGAIKEAVHSLHHSIKMIVPCPRLNVKQNANRRQGSVVVGTFKEDVLKNSSFYTTIGLPRLY